MDALKNETELSEQIKKLAEHLTFIERKLDQLLEARDRQPSHNENPRREFQQRPGGFRPNNYRPNGGPGFRPNRPGYGQGGGRPYDANRPQPGREDRPSGGHQGGHKPFHAKYSSPKNQHRRG